MTLAKLRKEIQERFPELTFELTRDYIVVSDQSVVYEILDEIFPIYFQPEVHIKHEPILEGPAFVWLHDHWIPLPDDAELTPLGWVSYKPFFAVNPTSHCLTKNPNYIPYYSDVVCEGRAQWELEEE